MLRILMLILLTPLLAVGQEISGGGTGGAQREQENVRVGILDTALGNLSTLVGTVVTGLTGSCPAGQILTGFNAGTLTKICTSPAAASAPTLQNFMYYRSDQPNPCTAHGMFDTTCVPFSGPTWTNSPYPGIVSITRSGTIATVTTNFTHGLDVGDYVSLVGVNQAQYLGQKTITAVGSPTTFQFTVVSTAPTPATFAAGWWNPYFQYYKQSVAMADGTNRFNTGIQSDSCFLTATHFVEDDGKNPGVGLYKMSAAGNWMMHVYHPGYTLKAGFTCLTW